MNKHDRSGKACDKNKSVTQPPLTYPHIETVKELLPTDINEDLPPKLKHPPSRHEENG